MNSSNSHGGKRNLRLACVVTVALVALIAATGTTSAQDKQDSQLPVHNPNDDLMFKPFGRPLTIDLGDGNERTLYLLEGNSPQDKRDPAHLTYYHDLALALVPREEPLPGFPAWVQKVINRENETVLDIRFRLSSPKLRAAAAAKLRSDMRAYFDQKRQELKVPAIKIELQPVPAYELRLYIQDRASGLTLAWAQENIRSWNRKDVTLSFRFTKESLAAFLQFEKDGTLQFTPYYKVRAEDYETARKQTTVNYAVGLKVKQLLDHRQRSKLKNEDENTILPILQDHVNTIARQIGAEINSDIVATDPALITFLHSDTMLVSSCFEPATTLSFADFHKAYPGYTDEMLAEYLKPYGVTKYQGKTTETAEGKQHTDEKTKQSGGGFSFLGIVGAHNENTQRALDTIYNATGIRLVKASSENFYKPSEVKVYKLAQGYEEKTLSQASSVTVTKGQVQSYMDLSPFPQTYVAEVVDRSMSEMLNKNDHVTRLLGKKAELEAALDTERAKVEKARLAIRTKVGVANEERRKLHDYHVSYRQPFGKIQEQTGNVQFSRLIRGTELEATGLLNQKLKTTAEEVLRNGRSMHGWTWRFNPDEDIKSREAVINAEKGKADSIESAIVASNKSLDEQFAEILAQEAVIQQAQSEIARLRGEIDRVTKEILSILER